MSVVVVGGGISGILSALLLAQKSNKVYLVEKASNLGGLLNSYISPKGESFDYGTHFLRETGNPELDRILFDGVKNDGWHHLDHLKAGSYFSGKLNTTSPYIDLRSLPKPAYDAGIADLLDAASRQEAPKNLEEQLKSYFGNTFYERAFRPALLKLFGVEPSSLALNAHILFGLNRALILTPEISRTLKQLSFFDRCIAYHDNAERTSTLKYFYPKEGGVGRWIENLTGKLRKAGVEILTGVSTAAIECGQGRVKSLKLDNGAMIACEEVVWTIPVSQFLRTAGIPFASKPPRRLSSNLYHFIFDKPFLTDLHYLSCFDASLSQFRATFYSNIGNGATGAHRMTVEVLSDKTPDSQTMLERVKIELIKMGVMEKTAKTIYEEASAVSEGFPVFTAEFSASVQDQLHCAKQAAANVRFLGKASGSVWFMQDVLLQAYHEFLCPPIQSSRI